MLIQKNELQELRIENCDVKIDLVQELIEKIYDKNFLKTVALVNLKINEKAF
jgi:hypothetical protein